MIPSRQIPVDETAPRPCPRLAWWGWGGAALGYFVAASVATWPVLGRFGIEIPGELTDPLEHLWIMRWLRTCLLAGQNPLFCPAIQAPVGVPLGAFPTLHLQTILYILLRLVTDNDAAIFTITWFVGFVATGVAAFGLARWSIPGVGPGVAWVAGLGAMLCGPMLMHAHGHLETMQMGVVPPFLIAWIGFVDGPRRGRLALAAASYLLVVAAAPYFAVLAIFPATWYVAWSVGTSAGRRTTVRRLLPWLVGFGALVLPGVVLLFGAQIQAALAGYPMTRSRRLFDHFGAPPWSGLIPTSRHSLGRLGGLHLFELAGYRGRMTECASYLGVAAVGLLAWAAARRVAFPRRGYWWSVLGLLVVLSWGSRLELFGASVPLPAGWIYPLFPPFHLIRVPARFNLFAAAVAVVPAAAGLRAIVAATWHGPARAGLLAFVAVATVIDLAMVPFPTAAIPDPPASYAAIGSARPAATVVDAPLFDSTQGQTFSSLWGYWQQRTGLATSGGYPGLTNARFDSEVARGSIFLPPGLDGATGSGACGRDGALDARDRAWLEMTVRGYDFAVLHLDPGLGLDLQGRMTSLADRLAEGVIGREPTEVTVARDRLRPPGRLVWLSDRGWRPLSAPNGAAGRSAAFREARIAIYQPEPGGPVDLTLLGAEAFAAPRIVRIVEDGRELAHFRLEPGEPRLVRPPPIDLPPGLHAWTLRSDGDARPTRSADRLAEAATPYSFRLTGVRLSPAGPH